MKSLAKNAFFNIIYKLISIIFPLLTTAYVSRILMPVGIGIVSYAQNIASYFVAVASLGLPVYGVREIAKVRENRKEKNKLYSELIIINAIFTIIAFVSYVVLILVISKFKKNMMLYLACGIPICLNFLNIDWLYQAEEEYKYIALRSTIIKTISLLAVILLVRNKQDYIIYAVILSVASVGNYIFNAIHARKFVSLSLNELNFRRHCKPVVSLGLVVILSAIYNKIDVTMLGNMCNDSVVGFYSNAHRGIDVFLTFCAAITSTFLPRLSIYSQSKREKLQGLLCFGYDLISFISFPAMTGIIVLSPQITVVLFGEAFSPAATTLRIFALLIIIRVYGDLFSYQLLIAIGRENKRVLVATLATIANIILNWILIPIIKQDGAAIASVISEVIMNGILFVYVIREIDLKLEWSKPLAQGVLSSLVMGIVVVLVTNPISNIYIQCLIGVTSGVIVYVLLNYFLKNRFMLQITSEICK